MDDRLYQILLQRLGGEGGGPSMPDLLSQLGDADPRYATLAQLLARRRAAESEQDESSGSTDQDPDIIDVEPLRHETEPDERRKWSRRLRRMVNNMYRELQQLRARNDGLAAALGACYLCWGEDVLCPVCHGQGQPGAFRSDPELFSAYVAPALQRPAEAASKKVDKRDTPQPEVPARDAPFDERRR